MRRRRRKRRRRRIGSDRIGNARDDLKLPDGQPALAS
jgi:hypothetical protein